MKKLKDFITDIKFRCQDLYDEFLYCIIDNFKYYGFLGGIYNSLIYTNDTDKFLKYIINKQFECAGISNKDLNIDNVHYTNWYDYIIALCKKDNQNRWYAEYHFKTAQQEEEVMKAYYMYVVFKMMRSEYYAIREWSWFGLQFGLTIEKGSNGEYVTGRSIEDVIAEFKKTKQYRYNWLKIFHDICCGKELND